MVLPPARFETERLILRPPTLADAEALYAGYAQDPDVTRYLVWRPHKSVEETRDFIRRCEREWARGNSFAFALLHKESGRLIGMAEFGADGVLGYVLEKASWGRGLMAEALKPLVAWGLGPGGLAEMSATCDVDNPASARVMEKAGMAFVGRLSRQSLHPNVSAEPRDALRYAVRRKA